MMRRQPWCNQQRIRVGKDRYRLLVKKHLCRSSSSSGSNRNHSSSTSSHSDPKHDYGTNSGVIEGVWVFHRHGDRTPSRPLCPDPVLAQESNFWISKLPCSDFIKEMYDKFPVQIHPSNSDTYLDAAHYPFGCLTKMGCIQMQKTGQRMALRYKTHGYNRRRMGDDSENAWKFLQDWDVRVYSTNYLRTVTSAQFFLDGLICSHVYNDHDMNSDNVDSEVHQHLVPIQVRDRNRDTLNAFDKNPALMQELVSEVISSDFFQRADTEAVPLASRLASQLPGLTKHNKSTFGGPSGINWIHACDHFVCRDAHGVPLTAKFDDTGGYSVVDGALEEAMRAMAHPTMAHLSWRFRQWYKSPPLLSAIAAPPLREVLIQLCATPSLTPEDKRPFTVYSCHDVTILSLLYGIGADIISKYKTRFWPAYSSTLVFELVRTAEGRHVVRIFLNGKSVSVLKREKSTKKSGRRRLMTVQDFSELVQNLEKMGSDLSWKLRTDEEQKRDMTVWTG